MSRTIISKIMKKGNLTYDEAIKDFNINILDKNPTKSFILATDENQDIHSLNNILIYLQK